MERNRRRKLKEHLEYQFDEAYGIRDTVKKIKRSPGDPMTMYDRLSSNKSALAGRSPCCCSCTDGLVFKKWYDKKKAAVGAQKAQALAASARKRLQSMPASHRKQLARK